jgi:hypothetical protein
MPRVQFAEKDELRLVIAEDSIKEMAVLKKGLVFLGFAVSLYPVFVGLLTVPWLQRQCVFAFFFFSFCSFACPFSCHRSVFYSLVTIH